jgi:Putative Actinobacterial Holin-X, holin superfamily III
MHTQGTDTHPDGGPGLGTAAKEVAEHASALARLELELAALELKQKLGALGVGVGLAIGAAVFLLYMLGFGFATIAAGLATFLDMWLALLIVTVFLLLVGAVLGLFAMRAFRRGTPPVPQQAIREAKLTTEAIKSNGH